MKETNMEHFRGEIEKEEYGPECDFFEQECGAARVKWLMSPYKPEPVLTEREKHFVEFVQTGYIARDKSGGMWWHEKKPAKDNEEWQSFSYTMAMNSKPYKYGKDFPFITWEDEEPWAVEDLRKLKVGDQDET